MKKHFDHPWLPEAAGHLIIIALGWGIFYLTSMMPPSSPALTFEVLHKKLEFSDILQFEESKAPPSSATEVKDSSRMRSIRPSSEQRSFQLDSLTFEDLVLIGLSKKMAHTWMNYVKAGGNIRYKEDVERLYGISSSDIEKLEEAVELPRRPDDDQGMVDINSATSKELRQLKGIGPVLSKRIVKFRDKLGGFVSLDQVAETYGVSDSLVQALSPFLMLSEVKPSIKINAVSQDSLVKHPYIDWKQARVIIRYRDEHGPFQSENDLLKTRVVDSEWVNRISAYIDWTAYTKTE
jgi:DNA uptake protein ComE-like DNA-binding protein